MQSTPQEEQCTDLRGTLAKSSRALAVDSEELLAVAAGSADDDEASPLVAAALAIAGVRSFPLES